MGCLKASKIFGVSKGMVERKNIKMELMEGTPTPTMDISVYGFEITGLIPVNRNVYVDAKFGAEAPKRHTSPLSKISTPCTPQPTVADPNLRISSQDI
ncbi:hypothetical protein ILUMI_04667 [Ignelater luminosus]|uniref:Uncharacterized protein n=1 Tax=Ignelater luminosus TaxID=2038154 RepID=A0A8K0DCF5_IGNLU|nr:hypothetical protein ILUMI_04667 [Ignelater luminosus]